MTIDIGGNIFKWITKPQYDVDGKVWFSPRGEHPQRLTELDVRYMFSDFDYSVGVGIYPLKAKHKIPFFEVCCNRGKQNEYTQRVPIANTKILAEAARKDKR
jgi:hypothetical protein